MSTKEIWSIRRMENFALMRNFTNCYGDQIENDEMSSTSSTNGENTVF
jgi:hypothetical protein